MYEEIKLLLLGSLIGLMSSFVTRVFDDWLATRRQRREWEKQRREKELDEIHQFMSTGHYREINPSTNKKSIYSSIFFRGSTIALLLGLIALILMIMLGLFLRKISIQVWASSARSFHPKSNHATICSP